jgi:Vanillate O-demethylase oxygenase C-terminal domain
LFDRNRQTSYGRFRLPSIAQLEYRATGGVKVRDPKSTHRATHTRLLLTGFITPVDEKRLTVHIVTAYRWTFLPGWLTHLLIKPLFWLALKQDQRILKQQQDNIDRCGGEALHSTEMDLMRAPIRQLLTQAQARNTSEKTVQFRL